MHSLGELLLQNWEYHDLKPSLGDACLTEFSKLFVIELSETMLNGFLQYHSSLCPVRKAVTTGALDRGSLCCMANLTNGIYMACHCH